MVAHQHGSLCRSSGTEEPWPWSLRRRLLISILINTLTWLLVRFIAKFSVRRKGRVSWCDCSGDSAYHQMLWRQELARTATTTDSDVIITEEVGGTVGDIESLPFLESASSNEGWCGLWQCYVYPHNASSLAQKAAGEMKTKPAQHSVRVAGFGYPTKYVSYSDKNNLLVRESR